LIPLQEPAEAVKELRRIVKELGFCGAMLPSTGPMQSQNHLGDERYWPIYKSQIVLAAPLASTAAFTITWVSMI
jgi:predicted TIM-barrel fold metal-dependent hydrolase